MRRAAGLAAGFDAFDCGEMLGLRLIFINRFFHPDYSATSQLLSDLAFGLAGRVPVTVITSRMNYEAPGARLPDRETINGVEVHRVWTSRFGRTHLAGRSIDYLTFYLSAVWALFLKASRGDVVVAMTDPPMLSLVALPVTKLRGARLVNWLQDLFPEIAEALGVGGAAGAAAFRPLKWARNASLRRADVNVAIGALMAARLSRLGVLSDRIRVLPNWADSEAVTPVRRDDNRLRAEWCLGDKFIVGYSGNLGRAHDIETLLEAIGVLEAGGSPSNVQWLFIGGGTLFEALKHKASERGLTSVTFKPYQPRARLAESLSTADIHLVSLQPNLEGLIVPSKFYGVAAAGRPTVFIGASDGEIAELLRRYDCGTTVAIGDGRALATAVQEMAKNPARCESMGANARSACEASYSKSAAIEAWYRLLGDVARH